MTLTDQDIILRPVAIAGGQRHYVLLRALSQHHALESFHTLGDAVLAAQEFAARGFNVWHEQVDDRGRVMGPPLRLFSGYAVGSGQPEEATNPVRLGTIKATDDTE